VNSAGLQIAYLSADDPRNKKVWSGTHYNIYRSLQALGNVDILGPYKPENALLAGKIMNQLSLRLFKKRIDYRHGARLAKAYGKYFSEKLNNGKYDLIVAPAASAELSFLQTKIPVVYITDGTFSSCLNYHKALTDLTARSVEEGNTIEQQAIDKSTVTIVSSEWAARSAIRTYHCDPEKLKVLPFGANFEKIPTADELNVEKPAVWKLLFVGVYWESKGGEIAYNCFRELADKGYPVELTVLGCIPPEQFRHGKMKVIPFIDKNSGEGQKKLFEIFLQHHILILPTRFDCTPIVINESSAFGIPSIVAKTGGVEGHLKNGVNGFLVDYNDKGKGYAEQIEKLIKEPEQYIALRKSSRILYDEKLNWNSWTEEFKKIVARII
jgi:glycosyltransferase involved in cell wall biosynthesis